MKILFPIGSFYPSQSGGPNNTIYWITKGLEQEGVNALIVTTNHGLQPHHNIKLNKWLHTDYGKVIYCKTFFIYIPLTALLSSINRVREVDVIHLTAIFYPLSWLVAISNKILWRKKIIWSPRGELDDKALVYSTWKKKPVLWIIDKFLKKKYYFSFNL